MLWYAKAVVSLLWTMRTNARGGGRMGLTDKHTVPFFEATMLFLFVDHTVLRCGFNMGYCIEDTIAQL